VRISRLAPSRRVWIFDLDNTLHDATVRIFPAMHDQINAFLRREFGVDEDGANRMREDFWLRYGTTLNGLSNSRYSSRMLRDQNEKSKTTSVPARTSSTRRARSASSMSRRTSCRSGIAVMPRDQASWSKDSRVIPCCSYRRATVDFPDPAGPHMKMTRPIRATLGADGLAPGQAA